MNLLFKFKSLISPFDIVYELYEFNEFDHLIKWKIGSQEYSKRQTVKEVNRLLDKGKYVKIR